MAGRDRSQDWSAEGQVNSPTAGKSEIGRSSTVSSSGRVVLRPARSFLPQGIFTQVKAIADTGFLVAFANKTDRHHRWAVGIASQVTEPLLTCEAVLAETAFHLGGSAQALAFIREGLVQLAFTASEHLDRLGELAKRYADRHPDFADLCLIRLSELHPTYPVITTDLSDFRVYRRNRNAAIALISPLIH